MNEEEWQQAANQLETWLDQSGSRDADILLTLSYAYWQQELWQQSLAAAVEHVDLLINREEEIPLERFKYLSALAFASEDLESAAWITQVMINEFNEINDWQNLYLIYDRLGNTSAAEKVLQDAADVGLLDELETSLETYNSGRR